MLPALPDAAEAMVGSGGSGMAGGGDGRDAVEEFFRRFDVMEPFRSSEPS